MAFFEAYSLDQLQRLLTVSKWLLIVCGVLFLAFVIVNHWISARISALQADEFHRTQQQLRASRTEMLREKAKTTELNAELSRFVAPRSLSEEQIDGLKKCLADGP